MEKLEQKNICVDTDIIIDFTKDKEPFATCLEYVHTHFNCFITAISVYELYFGVEYAGGNKERNILDDLLKGFIILSFDVRAAKISAAIDAKLNKRGQRLEIKDILIASICISNNIPLLTQNTSHFSRFHELKLFPVKDILR